MSCDKSSCLCWCLWPCLRAWSAGTLAQEVSKPLWVGFPLHLPRPLGLWLRGPVGRAGAGKQVAGGHSESGRPPLTAQLPRAGMSAWVVGLGGRINRVRVYWRVGSKMRLAVFWAWPRRAWGLVNAVRGSTDARLGSRGLLSVIGGGGLACQVAVRPRGLAS